MLEMEKSWKAIKVILRQLMNIYKKFPPEIQEILQRIREVIKESAPDAEEKISYQMPTFALHGNLVHFAAF